MARDANEIATDAAPPVLGTAVGEAAGEGANPQVAFGESGSRVTSPRRADVPGVWYTIFAAKLLCDPVPVI
jgi:hypothetical protein